MNIYHVLLVGAGGFAGSIARFLVSVLMMNRFPSSFPYGTFAVNVTGCFFLGAIIGYTSANTQTDMKWKLLLGTGFCGGFTTFSAFAIENLSLIDQKLVSVSLVYTMASLFAGLVAALAGIAVGRLAAS